MIRLFEKDFDRKIFGRTIAVMFYADWCDFCKDFRKVFHSSERTTNFEFAEVDISKEKNPLWEKFNIQVVPSIIVFRKNKPIYRKDGILGIGLKEQDVKDMIEFVKVAKWEDPSIVFPEAPPHL